MLTSKLFDVVTSADCQGEFVIPSKVTIGLVKAASKRRLKKVSLSEEGSSEIAKNRAFLDNVLNNGTVIYGINTGFGGSADVRCQEYESIQRALVRHLNAGFGPKMSTETVRAAMFLRATCLGRAYSGVRPEVVRTLLSMLDCDIVPVIPLRGSVSASGDLMPMSYVAAAVMGRDIAAVVDGKQSTIRQAFDKNNIKPLTFGAKEGLAIANSCSASVALASTVLYDACSCLLLTQAATALCMEALQGKIENFHHTPHAVMPHQGQIEVASTMRHWLTESKFCVQGTTLEINYYLPKVFCISKIENH